MDFEEYEIKKKKIVRYSTAATLISMFVMLFMLTLPQLGDWRLLIGLVCLVGLFASRWIFGKLFGFTKMHTTMLKMETTYNDWFMAKTYEEKQKLYKGEEL